MVRVAQRGRFAIYVYAEKGQPHHKPHCHVVWSDGAASVAIRSGQQLAGSELPSRASELIRESMDEIVIVWNRLNPGRPVQ